MQWLDIVNESKNLRFYIRYAGSLLVPKYCYRHALDSKLDRLKAYDLDYTAYRVNYYNKLTSPFYLQNPVSMQTFYHKGNSAMQCDFKNVMRYFEETLCFNFILGDTTHVPATPSFVKSRPIQTPPNPSSPTNTDNQNSVLLRLDSARHLNFVNDPIPFEKKKNIALWRGAVHDRPVRVKLLQDFMNHPNCDVRDTNKHKRGEPTFGEEISFSEQLKNKFIISIEGNDVATNTKWIMSSNSLCFMPKPKYETWFMEGELKDRVHYVQIKDDLSDLEEKIEYYSTHVNEAKEIIHNAHDFIAPFRDRKYEQLISLLVIDKYFDLCENNASYHRKDHFKSDTK